MVTVLHGDALDILTTLPDASVDAVVTDPPYALEFMGKGWDRFTPAEFQAWCDGWAKECHRVLKPGGHLLAFGGTRTFHRLTCGIEDAGFQIRDTITWLYGSGFPKSLDVSKAIDGYHLTGGKTNSRAIRQANDSREVVGTKLGLPGKSAGQQPDYFGGDDGAQWRGEDVDNMRNRLGSSLAEGGHRRDLNITAPATDDARRWHGWGTALKPASEPIVVARKPLAGTVAANVLAHGTGAINIDGCRVDTGPPPSATGRGINGARSSYIGPERFREDVRSWDQPAGRWPSNVVLSHPAAPDGGDACAAGCVEGCPVAELDAQSGVSRDGVAVQRNGGGQRIFGQGPGMTRADSGYGGGGGASRFFPTFRYQAKAPTRERPRVNGVAHPTVKPVALMRWLVRLVTPPGGTVLDPFAGSGTTAEACYLEGLDYVVIEREKIYLPLINDRLVRASGIEV